MQPFRSIAIRYLPDYLAWTRVIERVDETINQMRFYSIARGHDKQHLTRTASLETQL